MRRREDAIAMEGTKILLLVAPHCFVTALLACARERLGLPGPETKRDHAHLSVAQVTAPGTNSALCDTSNH